MGVAYYTLKKLYFTFVKAQTLIEGIPSNYKAMKYCINFKTHLLIIIIEIAICFKNAYL